MIVDDDVATRLRGFGPLGVVAILIILAGNAVFIPLSALLALAWVWIYGLQGFAGVQQGTIVGLVFGTIAVITGRIIMLMVAHAAFDLTALAIIYWDIEAAVAHLIF